MSSENEFTYSKELSNLFREFVTLIFKKLELFEQQLEVHNGKSLKALEKISDSEASIKTKILEIDERIREVQQKINNTELLQSVTDSALSKKITEEVVAKLNQNQVVHDAALCQQLSDKLVGSLENKLNKFVATKTITIVTYVALGGLILFELVKLIGIDKLGF